MPDRQGHGQWCAIKDPVIGVLWRQDDGMVGFEPAPGQPGIDNPDWDTLTEGRYVTAGDLRRWKPDAGQKPYTVKGM